MVGIVKEILIAVEVVAVIFAVVGFLTWLEEKIKSCRKNGCKIKCLCKHEYDVHFVDIIHRVAILKCRKCGKKKKIKNLSNKTTDKLWYMK